MYVRMRESDRVESKNAMGFTPRKALSSGIFLLDENCIVRFCNESLLRRIEISFEKICGQSINMFIPDFPTDVVSFDYETAVDATMDKPKMARLQLPKGGCDRVRLTVMPFFKNGKSSLVVIVEPIDSLAGSTGGRDIASLMATSEAKVDAVAITDFRGNIEFVNRAFELMTGFNCEELIGKSIQHEQLGLSGADRKPKFWEDLQVGKSFSAMSVHRKKDGSRFHHEQSVRPFVDAVGVVTHAVFTGHDVSQRVSAMLR